jgi:hypothetical protein
MQFIEVVVRGGVSLFKAEDFYFVEKDTAFIRLINDDEERYVDGRMVLRPSNKFIGVLLYLMSDCPTIKSQVQTVRLHEKSLTRLIEDYNVCMSSPSVTYKSSLPHMRATFALGAGYIVSKATAINNSDLAQLLGDFQTNNSPVIGFSVDFLTPRISQRLMFHAGLFYHRSKRHASGAGNVGTDLESHDITMELNRLAIPAGLKYFFPGRTIKPYLNGGVIVTMNPKPKGRWLSEIETTQGTERNETSTFLIVKQHIGFWGGVGISKKISPICDMFLEARVSQTNEAVSVFKDYSGNVGTSVRNVELMLGIRTR